MSDVLMNGCHFDLLLISSISPGNWSLFILLSSDSNHMSGIKTCIYRSFWVLFRCFWYITEMYESQLKQAQKDRYAYNFNILLSCWFTIWTVGPKKMNRNDWDYPYRTSIYFYHFCCYISRNSHRTHWLHMYSLHSLCLLISHSILCFILYHSIILLAKQLIRFPASNLW